MYRLASLIICLLLIGQLSAQEKFFKELRYRESQAEVIDVARLNDGTFLLLITRDSYSPKYRTTTILAHINQAGDWLAWLNIGTPEFPMMFQNFMVRNDSLLLESLSTSDSLDPYFARNGVNITTYSVSTSPLSITPVHVSEIETAFSVHTQKFKALNWTPYFPQVGYDSEVCRFGSDSGTGYRINVPGSLSIGQLIETADGGVITLGTVSPSDGGFEADIYMLRLDKELHPVWEKRIGRSPSITGPPGSFFCEVLTEACLLPDSSLLLLGNVTRNNSAVSYYVVKCNPRGEVLWQRSDCDTIAKDSVNYYSNAAHILPMPDGGCMITGHRNSKKDPVHSAAFAIFFDGSGNIVSSSSQGMKGTWVAISEIETAGEDFYLFGHHIDITRRSVRSLVMCRLNKKGKFVPFRK